MVHYQTRGIARQQPAKSHEHTRTMSNETKATIEHKPATSNHVFQTIKPGTKKGRWANPQVTMNAKGLMKLNRVAFEKLGEPERIRVLFDTASQQIKLAAAAPDDEDAHE